MYLWWRGEAYGIQFEDMWFISGAATFFLDLSHFQYKKKQYLFCKIKNLL
jgi:hypothetical protein